MNSNTQIKELNLIDLKEYILKVHDLEFNLREKINIDEKLLFGIEIEFSDAVFETIQMLIAYQIEKTYKYDRLEKNYSKWCVTNEPSVQKSNINNPTNNIIYGGEIISPILSNKKENWLILQRVCNILKENNARTKKCGGHIHLNKAYFLNKLVEEKFYENLILLWYYYEYIIYRFGNGDLNHTRLLARKYAKPINKLYKKEDYLDIYDNLNIEQIKLLLKIKKYALRITNYSLEIRNPNGTLNPVRWQNNINVFASILETSANDKLDIEKLKYKIFNREKNNKKKDEISDLLEFTDLIFNTDIDKMYFLKSYFDTTKVDNKILKKENQK